MSSFEAATESEVPLSEVVPDYSREEYRNTLEEASRIEVDRIAYPEVSWRYFINKNAKHLGYNICIWLLLVTVVGLAVVTRNALVVAIPLVVFCTFCIPYLATSLETPDFFINSWKSEEEAAQILINSVSQKPRILQKIRCFHLSKVNGGNDLQVVTYRQALDKEFLDWFDASPEQSLQFNHTEVSVESPLNADVKVESREIERSHRHEKICRIYVKLDYSCNDDETREDFRNQKEALIEANRTRDDDYTYEEAYFLENVPKTILVNRSKGRVKSILYSFRMYLCCALIGCAFPFRLLLECCCVKSQVWENKKVLSINDLEAAIEGRNVEVAEVLE